MGTKQFVQEQSEAMEQQKEGAILGAPKAAAAKKVKGGKSKSGKASK
jgi:hypothetical protein